MVDLLCVDRGKGGERERERERERELVTQLSMTIQCQITHPDPLPPTRATFFPAGTLKSSPFSMGRSGV